MDEHQRLRILLVLKHTGYMGVYASLVRELAERGHAVHVAYLARDPEGLRTLEGLADRHGISHGPGMQRRPVDGWRSVAWLARALGDLARYSDPRFADAPALRNRMAAKVQGHLCGGANVDPLTRRLALRRARRLHARSDAELAEREIRTSQLLESAIPISGRVTSFIRKQAPDVVLVSPLIDLASPLLEYLKAARRLRIRTGICVASWDNLTSKGLLRFVPERVFVWNEIQRREAVELHGIPEDCVIATGAARFDDWFTRRPSSNGGDFARRLALDPRLPFLLYVCSSGFVAPDEVEWVTSWIRSLRASDDDRLRTIGVVVRPHPKRVDLWRGVDLAPYGNAVVWPPPGSSLATATARTDFYDSIAHCAGVVGVNTSAMLEAAIVGKTVYTWVAPEFAQEGTVHFHYLLHENGGFLHVAESQEDHFQQLLRGLSDQAQEGERARRFIESFLRPGGADRSATALYADAIESLARLPLRERAPASRARFALRIALAPMAAASTLSLVASIAKAAARSRLPGEPRSEAGKPRVGPARA
jgi:hypothetical protein